MTPWKEEATGCHLRGKWKAEVTDSEQRWDCGLHSCKFGSSKRRSEEIGAVPLSCYVISLKLLDINILFCELKKL
jgi:hypothetical protein